MLTNNLPNFVHHVREETTNVLRVFYGCFKISRSLISVCEKQSFLCNKNTHLTLTHVAIKSRY